ncbi:MAG: 4-hydroxyphenylpyruvate dioxygenase [Planctomycetota bacterium]|nr:4-hydroxyphenylpyruvate dioxygenase [Planctomycetota bacterium]
MSFVSPEASPSISNPLGIRGIDHLKYYVDDVDKWADFHERQLGMFRRAVGNPQTGLEGQKAVVCGQGRVNFVFIEAEGDCRTANEIRAFVDRHGCGVKDIAFRVDNVEHAVSTAVSRGAELDHSGESTDDFELGSVKTYGDTIHTFIHRKDRMFLPGFCNEAGGVESGEIHLMMIDHIVANVEDMDHWVDYYAKVFGFDETAHFDIQTGRSALMSKVVGDVDGYIRLPINEPSSDNSQIQEFLDEFNGAGVQHVALLTPSIVDTVMAMRAQGADFLAVPETYYEALPARVGQIKESIEDIQRASVLVDRDREDGYLLQLFTKPIFDRPTLFYEIIQRHGNSVGFGEGNFQALFEAIELEQEKRGSL